MRTILLEADGPKGLTTFRVTVPDSARLTFGPWSPPSAVSAKRGWEESDKRGTLRVYEGAGTAKILAVFTGVRTFRDTSIKMAEQVIREGSSAIWRDDDGAITQEGRGFTPAQAVAVNQEALAAGRTRRNNGRDDRYYVEAEPD